MPDSGIHAPESVSAWIPALTDLTCRKKIVAKAKKTHKVVAPKTQNETNGIQTSKPTPKPTEKPKPVLDLSKKPPTSPGRQSQRSPRSPARLIHEKHDVRVTSQQTAKTPSQPDENDSLPTDCPSPLREKCENLRKIAELQNGLSSKQFFTPAVNQMLLEIEELSQSISQKIRSNIYSYLVKVLFYFFIFKIFIKGARCNFLSSAYAMYSRHICWSDQKDKN